MARPSIHAGEVLAYEPQEVGVMPIELAGNRLMQIIHRRRGINRNTGPRFEYWVSASAQFWLTLQSAHSIVAAKKRVGTRSPSCRCEARPALACHSAYRP